MFSQQKRAPPIPIFPTIKKPSPAKKNVFNEALVGWYALLHRAPFS
ncbi:MAG: hypothetical protein ACI92E_002328 [Oceanicoccus sp.]|jgi:hypothetical protein